MFNLTGQYWLIVLIQHLSQITLKRVPFLHLFLLPLNFHNLNERYDISFIRYGNATKNYLKIMRNDVK